MSVTSTKVCTPLVAVIRRDWVLSSPTVMVGLLIGSKFSFWLFGTAACILTFSNLEPMESFRKIAWMETFPGPVRVGCSDTVRSFLEYATIGAKVSHVW